MSKIIWKIVGYSYYWKISYTVLEIWILYFSSYENRILKANLWWVGAQKRSRRASFEPPFCPKEIFFNICVLSQWILDWINFQNIHIFTFKKALVHTNFYLLLKSLKTFSVFLRQLDILGALPLVGQISKPYKVPHRPQLHWVNKIYIHTIYIYIYIHI